MKPIVNRRFSSARASATAAILLYVYVRERKSARPANREKNTAREVDGAGASASAGDTGRNGTANYSYAYNSPCLVCIHMCALVFVYTRQSYHAAGALSVP